MDSIPNNTIYKERQFFLSKLKSNPIFFIKHIGSFSELLWHRLQGKFLIKLRGRHRGQKKRPAWLKTIKHVQQNESINFQDLLKRIPERKIPPHHCVQSITIDSNIAQSEDPEDYLFNFRWSRLIDDDCYAQQLPAYVNTWLTIPPPKEDLAWETYSTCERVANFLTWISFIPINERAHVIPTTFTQFVQESIEWIFAHLEYYGKQTGNHIINNARALIMGGVILKNEKAIQAGLLILHYMLPILIQSDGFLRERSSHYQLIVLTWLLDALTFMQKSDLCTERDVTCLKDTILRMCNAASIFCNETGDLQVYIGDISPDLTPKKTTHRLKICYPDYWPLSNIRTLKTSDWYQLICQQNKVLLNCPSGKYPTQIPSHAHGDITSFVWIYKEKPIFIDTGRSRYTKDPISSLQKSAVGHNVPLVNDLAPLCESLVVNGHWWPMPYALANIKVNKNINMITLEHDGFKRATPVKQHRRQIEIFPEAIEVRDNFIGKGQVSITLLWHLDATFTSFSENTLSINNGKEILSIDLSETKVKPNIGFHPTIGAHSCAYGASKPNPVLTLQWIVDLPFESKIKFRIKTCAA